jgi:hypothetical protein
MRDYGSLRCGETGLDTKSLSDGVRGVHNHGLAQRHTGKDFGSLAILMAHIEFLQTGRALG